MGCDFEFVLVVFCWQVEGGKMLRTGEVVSTSCAFDAEAGYRTETAVAFGPTTVYHLRRLDLVVESENYPELKVRKNPYEKLCAQCMKTNTELLGNWGYGMGRSGCAATERRRRARRRRRRMPATPEA
eukprot:COSAG05_NODE_4020_length_1714_cov_2.793189_1_plen_128_part_00